MNRFSEFDRDELIMMIFGTQSAKESIQRHGYQLTDKSNKILTELFAELLEELSEHGIDAEEIFNKENQKQQSQIITWFNK